MSLVPLVSRSDGYLKRAKELQRYFLENYAGSAPERRNLSDEFRKEFEKLILIKGFCKTSWEKMKNKVYFSVLGDSFSLKSVQRHGFDVVFYLNKGNFYFGLLPTNNFNIGSFDSYIPARLNKFRGKGIINQYCGVYSPYCWDERVLEEVLKP